MAGIIGSPVTACLPMKNDVCVCSLLSFAGGDENELVGIPCPAWRVCEIIKIGLCKRERTMSGRSCASSFPLCELSPLPSADCVSPVRCRQPLITLFGLAPAFFCPHRIHFLGLSHLTIPCHALASHPCPLDTLTSSPWYSLATHSHACYAIYRLDLNLPPQNALPS